MKFKKRQFDCSGTGENGTTGAVRAIFALYDELMKRSPKDRFEYLSSKGWKRVEKVASSQEAAKGFVRCSWLAPETVERFKGAAERDRVWSQTRALYFQIEQDLRDHEIIYYSNPNMKVIIGL